jgi:hypothetical protein
MKALYHDVRYYGSYHLPRRYNENPNDEASLMTQGKN